MNLLFEVAYGFNLIKFLKMRLDFVLYRDQVIKWNMNLFFSDVKDDQT